MTKQQHECTCGEEQRDNHYDINWWCEVGHHDRCDGTLRGATGNHWWCMCSCHPEPEETSASRAAYVTWRQARLRGVWK